MEKITKRERGILAICRLNKLWEKKEILKEIKLGKLEITFHWRSKSNLWGRFGGGWDWELGFQIGGRTIRVNCLVFSLGFYWRKKSDD